MVDTVVTPMQCNGTRLTVLWEGPQRFTAENGSNSVIFGDIRFLKSAAGARQNKCVLWQEESKTCTEGRPLSPGPRREVKVLPPSLHQEKEVTPSIPHSCLGQQRFQFLSQLDGCCNWKQGNPRLFFFQAVVKQWGGISGGDRVVKWLRHTAWILGSVGGSSPSPVSALEPGFLGFCVFYHRLISGGDWERKHR